MIFQWLNVGELSVISDVCSLWNNVANYCVKHRWKRIQSLNFCEKFAKTEKCKNKNPYYVFLLEEYGILVKAYNINNKCTCITFSTKLEEGEEEWEFHYHVFTVLNDYSFHFNNEKNELTIIGFYNQCVINDRLIPRSKEEFDIRMEKQTINIKHYGGCIMSMHKLIVSQNICTMCRFSPHELKKSKKSKFFVPK